MGNFLMGCKILRVFCELGGGFLFIFGGESSSKARDGCSGNG